MLYQGQLVYPGQVYFTSQKQNMITMQYRQNQRIMTQKTSSSFTICHIFASEINYFPALLSDLFVLYWQGYRSVTSAKLSREVDRSRVIMNAVPRSTINTNVGNRELTLKCKLKCYEKPMKDPLGVSPSRGNQGTTRGKEKFLLTSVGIEPTTSGLDLPLLCRLSYEVGQRKSGTI